MAKCVAVAFAATAAAAAGAGPLTKGGLIGAVADWFEMAPLRVRRGEPHWLGPESHFSQTPNKSQFLSYKAGENERGGVGEIARCLSWGKWLVGLEDVMLSLAVSLMLLKLGLQEHNTKVKRERKGWVGERGGTCIKAGSILGCKHISHLFLSPLCMLSLASYTETTKGNVNAQTGYDQGTVTALLCKRIEVPLSLMGLTSFHLSACKCSLQVSKSGQFIYL